MINYQLNDGKGRSTGPKSTPERESEEAERASRRQLIILNLFLQTYFFPCRPNTSKIEQQCLTRSPPRMP
ncbi:Hypothetical predicted protein [Scomber scombrus]|uniref:Uncharacterized protein n=1 Tax=Scomber scombrus TaxID=13677 RepID=A0AAV1PYJ3_SCOSC